MKNNISKVYSTKCTPYSTIGRRMIKIESKSITTRELLPKYGKALDSYNSKQTLEKLFN